MSWIAVITGTGIVSTAAGAITANKAANAARDASKASQVDVDALDAKTRDIAKKNALQSAELERQLTPEVPQIRTAANNGLLSQLGSNASENASESAILGGLGKPVGSLLDTPLLKAAIAKSRADLDLGGKLPQDVQNLVTRQALSNAGTVAPGNLSLGRDLTTRDLGLTSLQLENQRLQTASALGGQEMGIESENNNVRFNNASNLINQIQLLQAINSGRFNRTLASAQYGQSIQQPIVGLDPSSVADVVSGNATNKAAGLASQANIYGAQGQGLNNFAGQLLGYSVLGAAGKPASTSTPTVAATPNPYPLLTTSRTSPFLASTKPFGT